jgi:predicted secreted protein
MTASNAILGFGSSFSIENENSPNEYTELDEILSIDPPTAAVDQIDVTHMQSPNRRREFISGLIDGGEVAFEMNYIPGSASDSRLNELLDLPVGVSRRRNCKIVFPNHVVHTFDAELTEYKPSVPFDDKMTASVTFKVTGEITRTTT